MRQLRDKSKAKAKATAADTAKESGGGGDKDAKAKRKQEKQWRKERLKEMKQLRSELKANKAVKVTAGAKMEAQNKAEMERDMLTPLQQMRRRFSKRRREHGDRQQRTMDLLAQFTNDMRDTMQQDEDSGRAATGGEGSMRRPEGEDNYRHLDAEPERKKSKK